MHQFSSLQFAIKAELKQRPHIVVPGLFVVSILIASFILRAAEMPVDDSTSANGDEGSSFGWKYMWNSLWCTFITMTTVGYGDIYPVSTMGKLICVVMCLWGNFLISLIIVSLAEYVELNSSEAKAYFQVNNEIALTKTFTVASDLIKTFFRFIIAKRRGTKQQKWQKLLNLKKKSRQFKHVNTELMIVN